MSMSLDDGATEFLRSLDEGVQAKVLRPAAHAGSIVLQAAAKAAAPVYAGPPHYRDNGKPVVPGALRDAIYRAHSPEESTNTHQVYKVSWNTKKVGYAYLIENGHWRTNVVFVKDGKVVYTKQRLKTPVWVPPKPFMRRAVDAESQALAAMKGRAEERIQDVIDGVA